MKEIEVKMNKKDPSPKVLNLPPHCGQTVLVLQGGGALGSYQAGAYCKLAESGYLPNWVAGVSIGAINAAIIAGNIPSKRVSKLKGFWQKITGGVAIHPWLSGDMARDWFNQTSATATALSGVDGFFKLRLPVAWLWPKGSLEATSFYDTSELRDTLLEFVDFDLINTDHVRLSVGAVNIRSGNSVYFDNRQRTITPEHILASAALPPGFPAIEIEGERFWDGGVVSNTPLQYVLEEQEAQSSLVFQIDLFSARGAFPGDIAEVLERTKEIQYSSRTRFNTDQIRKAQNLRRAVHRLIDKLPKELQNSPEAKLLDGAASDATVSIVHLIYRKKDYESQSMDYEFSRVTMEEHWDAGVNDVSRTLRHPDWLEEPEKYIGVRTFDIQED